MTRSTGLPLTGERTVPGLWHENYWYQRHLAAYRCDPVSEVIRGYVLEAGCGEGYGAEVLRERCEELVALDYDASTVEHIRVAHAGIPVLRGNLVALPLRSSSLDAVVSLQTLEHLWDQDAFVAECIRVLRPNGHLVLSTPNRLTFSPGLGRGERPRNLFHAKELDPGELVDLLAAHATITAICGLRHGPSLEVWEQTYGSVVEAQLAEPYTAWPDGLVELVTSLTVDDFTVDDFTVDDFTVDDFTVDGSTVDSSTVDGPGLAMALDLIAIVTRP